MEAESRHSVPDRQLQGHVRSSLSWNSKAVVGPNTSLGLLSMTVGLNPLDNLLMLSEETGGFAISNTGDLIGGIEKIGSYKELVIYFVVRPRAASPQIDGSFEFFRDGVPDLKLEQALAAADAEGKVESVKQVGLDQLKPGSYELRVTVRNANASASGSARFRIDP